MAGQNIYDDPEFFAAYTTIDRQTRGLMGAREWPELEGLVGDPDGKRVIDLGCGFGWFSRWAVDRGARSAVGIDLSASMLERAAEMTDAPEVTYRLADLDELELPADAADLVFSSLAFHYVADLERLFAVVASALAPGGTLVFSVEHPIYSAPTRQEFDVAADGSVTWPLDDYLVEGERTRTWFVDGVRKHHRTVATHANAIVGSGLVLDRLVEWGPSPEEVAARPDWAIDLHRPWFLLVRAVKPPA